MESSSNITTILFDLLNEMKEMATSFVNPNLYQTALNVIKQNDSQEIASLVINSTHSEWTAIGKEVTKSNRGRNDNLILAIHKCMSNMFGSISMPGIETVKRTIDNNKQFDDDKLNRVFDKFVQMVKECILHIHNKRQPVLKGDPPSPSYVAHFFSGEVNLQYQSKLYGVILSWDF